MENKTYILQELIDSCPSIAQLDKTNVYSVYHSYFNDLSSIIISKIKSEQEPVYYFSAVTPYKVRDNYFTNLPEEILGKALGQHEYKNEVAEELETIAPLLNKISKKPIFNVPAGYFEKEPVPYQKTTKVAAKVVSLNVTGKKLFRYLGAAVITALLAVGAYLIAGKESLNSQAKSNSEMAEIKKLSEQEILDFLKTNSFAGNATSAAYNTTAKENDIKSSLRQMSDKEIQQFLQENGEIDEI